METAVFPAPHPYNWPVIGSQEDLNAASLDDVRNFFRTYYVPSNASLSIAGDFDPDEARRLVGELLRRHPARPGHRPRGPDELGLTGEVRMDMRDKVQLPRLSLVWPTGPMFDDDEAPLDILASVLGDGKSSRLHKTLVYDKRIARDVTVAHYTREIAGEFIVQITANPGQSLDEIEEIVHEYLEAFTASLPPSERSGRRSTGSRSTTCEELRRSEASGAGRTS